MCTGRYRFFREIESRYRFSRYRFLSRYRFCGTIWSSGTGFSRKIGPRYRFSRYRFSEHRIKHCSELISDTTVDAFLLQIRLLILKCVELHDWLSHQTSLGQSEFTHGNHHVMYNPRQWLMMLPTWQPTGSFQTSSNSGSCPSSSLVSHCISNSFERADSSGVQGL